MPPEQGTAEPLHILISKLTQSVPGPQNVRGCNQDVEIAKLPKRHVSIELLSENGALVSQSPNPKFAQRADQLGQFGRQGKVAKGDLAGARSRNLARDARHRKCASK